MDIEQASNEIGVSTGTVRRWIKTDKLDADIVNGKYDIPETALLEFAKTAPAKLPASLGAIKAYDWWQGHPAKGITPAKANSYLVESETGNISNMADLEDDMYERDPMLNSLNQVRKRGVLSKGWDILPNPGLEKNADIKRAGAQADFIKEKLERLSDDKLITAGASEFLGFNSLLDYLLEKIGRGFSCAELDWMTDKEWYPKSARKIHKRHFKVGSFSDTDYSPYELRLVTEGNDEGEPIPPYRYVVHYDVSSGYLGRAGLLRPSVWYYMFKHHGLKWFVRYAEIAAVMFRVFKYDPNSPTLKADIAMLKAAAADLGNAGYGIISKETDVTFESGSHSSDNNPSLQLVDYCDRALTTLWLGQTGTTMPTAGALGESSEQQDVLFDIMQADAISLMETIQRSIITPMALFNDNEVLCYFDIPYKPDEDQKSIADMLKVVATDIGLPIGYEYLYERLGIPEPKAGDKVTSPAASPLGFSKEIHLAIDKKKSRLARDGKVRAGIAEIETSAVSASVPAYAKLFKGITETNYETQLEKNKAAFVPAFRDVSKKQLSKVTGVIDKAFGKAIDNALSVKWNLVDLTAQQFMEWQAFSMATLEGELITAQVLAAVKSGLVEGLAEGTTFKTFLSGVQANLGIGAVKPYHLETVWRTNLATARAVSIEERGAKGDYVGWEFLGVDDADQTDICNERNGMFFPISNTAEAPPLHHRCRSEKSLVDRTEAEDAGYSFDGAPGAEPPAKGFESSVTTSYNNWVKDASGGMPKTTQDSLQSEFNKITK